MINPEGLEFAPLNCSLERTLGDYYQDFYLTLQLVEDGFHGGFDARGIPLVDLPGQGAFRHPVTTAQYAIGNMIAVRRGEADRAARTRILLDWLVESQEYEGEWAGCWLMRYDNPKYRWLRAPWTGALASGNAISALLRGWEMFGVAEYRIRAEAAYVALHVPHRGITLCDEGPATLWYEEYPGAPSMHVLNGHIYTLLGVLDYARVSGDHEAYRRWSAAAATALAHLDDFDLGYWSAYDLRWREPTSVYYHKNIHIPQLRILAALTGESGFDAVAERWEGYLQSVWCRARLGVELRLHRFRK